MSDTPTCDLTGIAREKERADLHAKKLGGALIRAVLQATPNTLPTTVRAARDNLLEQLADAKETK